MPLGGCELYCCVVQPLSPVDLLIFAQGDRARWAAAILLGAGCVTVWAGVWHSVRRHLFETQDSRSYTARRTLQWLAVLAIAAGIYSGYQEDDPRCVDQHNGCSRSFRQVPLADRFWSASFLLLLVAPPNLAAVWLPSRRKETEDLTSNDAEG